jgi:hypothetical protein
MGQLLESRGEELRAVMNREAEATEAMTSLQAALDSRGGDVKQAQARIDSLTAQLDAEAIAKVRV